MSFRSEHPASSPPRHTLLPRPGLPPAPRPAFHSIPTVPAALLGVRESRKQLQPLEEIALYLEDLSDWPGCTQWKSGLPGEVVSFLFWSSGSEAEICTGDLVTARGLRKGPLRPHA